MAPPKRGPVPPCGIPLWWDYGGIGHIPLEDGILVRVQVPQPFDSLRSLMAIANKKLGEANVLSDERSEESKKI